MQLTPTRWKLTAKRSNIFPKLSNPCAKSFAPSDHKHFTCAKKPPKNPARQFTLSEKPPLFSTYIQIFWTFLWGYSNECATTLKSRWENVAGINRSVKVRSPWKKQAPEVRMKLACEKQQWNEIVHKKKNAFFWGKNELIGQYNFFLKKFLNPNRIFKQNKTFISFWIFFSNLMTSSEIFVWKLSLQTKGKKVFCEKLERKKKLFYSRLNGVSSIHFVCWGDLFFSPSRA